MATRRRQTQFVLAALLTTTTALRSYLTLPDGTKVPIKTENDARARNYKASPTAGIALQRGPWYDFWRALGGTDAIYHGLDATERAWLQIEQAARLKSARGVPGPLNSSRTFPADRLALFRRALGAPFDGLAARLERELDRGATATNVSRGDRNLFVVVTIQRTGSTWLTHELDSHPCILSAGELFLDAKEGKMRHTTWRWTESTKFEMLAAMMNANLDHQDPLLEGVPHNQGKWRDRCVHQQTTGVKAEACGFKWMLSQGVDLAWDAWFGRLAQNHGISLIFLKRENLLRNFLSWYDKERHALSGGDGRVVTGRFRLPTEVLIEDMEKTQAQFNRLDKIAADAKKRGLRTLAVTYEGLQAPCRGCAEDKAAGLARVARFVRARAAIGSDAIDATLSTQVLPKPGACAGNFTFAGREDDGDVKLHAATVAESITNWPEVVAKLRGTRFEKYLTMDGSVLPHS